MGRQQAKRKAEAAQEKSSKRAKTAEGYVYPDLYRAADKANDGKRSARLAAKATRTVDKAAKPAPAKASKNTTKAANNGRLGRAAAATEFKPTTRRSASQQPAQKDAEKPMGQTKATDSKKAQTQCAAKTQPAEPDAGRGTHTEEKAQQPSSVQARRRSSRRSFEHRKLQHSSSKTLSQSGPTAEPQDYLQDRTTTPARSELTVLPTADRKDTKDIFPWGGGTDYSFKSSMRSPAKAQTKQTQPCKDPATSAQNAVLASKSLQQGLGTVSKPKQAEPDQGLNGESAKGLLKRSRQSEPGAKALQGDHAAAEVRKQDTVSTRRRSRRLTAEVDQKENVSAQAPGNKKQSTRRVSGKRKSRQSSENVDPSNKSAKSEQKQTSKILSPARQPLSPTNHNVLGAARPGIQIPEPSANVLQKPSLALPKNTQAHHKDKVVKQLQLGTQAPSSNAPANKAAASDPTWFDPSDQERVRVVESAMHLSSAPAGALPICRDTQARELLGLLDSHLSRSQGGSIYISGLPGTGKSLTVHEVARQVARDHSGASAPSVVSINCMTLKQPSAVFRRALDGFQSARSHAKTADAIIYPALSGVTSQEDAGAALRDFVSQPLSTPVKKGKAASGMLLLILDEMDHLVSMDKGVLYELFSLPQAPKSRLILVGISNSIDLAERSLPRLHGTSCQPHLMPFPGYTAQQIGAIIRQRLQTLPGPVFQEHAISFCARKVASHSGDMRRALEACACAVKTFAAEMSAPVQPPATDEGEADGALEPAKLAAKLGKRQLIGLGDMAKAISSLQGGAGAESAIVQAMKSLPQQQQLVLCAATKLLGQTDASGSITGQASGLGRTLTTPPATAKGPKSRFVSFMSPGCSPVVKTPAKSGRAQTPGNPPGSAQLGSVSRSGLLGSVQECVLGALHDSYTQLCRQVALKPLNSFEFSSACSTLADIGIITVGKAKEERLRKVSLKAHKDDIALALQDVRLLRNVLSLK